MNKNGLNPKQQQFVEAYIRTGNAAAAYREAGYNETKDTTNSAYQVANTPAVVDEIKKIQKKMNKRTELTYQYKLDLLLEGIKYYRDKKHYLKMGDLLKIANKMQGHNAPDKAFIVNSTIDEIKELTEQIIDERRRELPHFD